MAAATMRRASSPTLLASDQEHASGSSPYSSACPYLVRRLLVCLTLSSAARLHREAPASSAATLVMRRYLGGTGQHMAIRSAPCMRKPCMTSLGRSQIVATPGPEGCGTTELPSRQARPFRASGTDGCTPGEAALAVGVTCETWLTPKPRQNEARSHRSVAFLIETLPRPPHRSACVDIVRTLSERGDVRMRLLCGTCCPLSSPLTVQASGQSFGRRSLRFIALSHLHQNARIPILNLALLSHKALELIGTSIRAEPHYAANQCRCC